MERERFPDPEAIGSRAGFAAFVDRLRADLAADPDGWENPDLDSFLEALAAYTRDAPGYICNAGLAIDAERPSWELFALVLSGARVYE